MILLALLLAAPLTLSPPAASPDRPWGSPRHGLSCRLFAPATARQGDRLLVALELRYFPESGSVITKITDWWVSECTHLEATSAAGLVRVLSPVQSGMAPFPGGCGTGPWRDIARPAQLDSFIVPTLTNAGETLSTGMWQFVAVYDNDSHRIRFTHVDAPDSSTVWSGVIRSAPVTIRIDEGIESEIEFITHTGVRPIMDGEQAAWAFDSTTAVHRTARHRPGYLLGRTMDFEGGGNALTISSARWGGLLEYTSSNGILCRASADTIRIRQAVFETSNGDIHLWQPKSGDYRLFWEGTIVIPPVQR